MIENCASGSASESDLISYNRPYRRLAAIDHPRKARSYDYQSSPYTIDAIDEQGRNKDTTDWRYLYDNADRLIEAHGGLQQDRINTPAPHPSTHPFPTSSPNPVASG
jgi:hypothetical protein